VSVGDVLEVYLLENATTGYLWSADVVPDQLERLADEAPEAGLPSTAGAARGRVLRFRARRPGPGQLHLQCARPWEPEPLETIVLSVRVREG